MLWWFWSKERIHPSALCPAAAGLGLCSLYWGALLKVSLPATPFWFSKLLFLFHVSSVSSQFRILPQWSFFFCFERVIACRKWKDYSPRNTHPFSQTERSTLNTFASLSPLPSAHTWMYQPPAVHQVAPQNKMFLPLNFSLFDRLNKFSSASILFYNTCSIFELGWFISR